MSDQVLAARVRDARTRRGLSQDRLADLVGCHCSVIRAMENPVSRVGYSESLVHTVGSVLKDQWLLHYRKPVLRDEIASKTPTGPSSELASLVIAARARACLSAAEVAQRWGYSLDYLYKTERGERIPSQDALLALEQVLGACGLSSRIWLTEKSQARVTELEAIEPRTFAQEFELRRLRFGFTELGLAKRLGVPVASIDDWEAGRTVPRKASTIAAVFQLLGLEVIPLDFGIALRNWRLTRNLSRVDLARILLVSYFTVSKWERGYAPSRCAQERVERLLREST